MEAFERVSAHIAEMRDAINLAVKLLDGKLGGYPAEFIHENLVIQSSVIDSAWRPDT